MPMPRRLSSLVLAGCALALVSACGSSSPSSSTTTITATTATTAGANAAGTGKTTGTSSVPSEGIKVDGTPRFASPSPSAPVQSGVVQIAYRNIAIDPDTLRVKVGSTVRWTNYDSTKANVTTVNGPQRFASKNFGEGGTFEIQLTKPGVIHYECTLFPVTMNGTIEVVS
jgi:plastocyanin